MHVQLGPVAGDALLDRIEAELPRVLDTLRGVTEDTPAMLAQLSTLADRLADGAGGDEAECARLLRWLADGHFNTLGYRGGRRGAGESAPMFAATLGILGDRADTGLERQDVGGPLLRMSTGAVDSPLPGASDVCVISVRASSDAIEHVFVGTFTVTGLHENILDIPVVSQRVRQVINWAGFELGSYSGQAMLEMLQTLPRAELFSADARRLFETASAVMNLGSRRQLRLFLRGEPHAGAIHCLVYLPRDRYSVEGRLRMQDVLGNEFAGERVTYSVRVTESELAVAYFTVHRPVGAPAADISEFNRERVQEALFAATRTWTDRLLLEAAGAAAVAPAVVQSYATAFPAAYRQEHDPVRALAELRRLDRLTEGAIDTDLYRQSGAAPGHWRFTLYVAGAEVSLSRVLPVLHSLGVEVVDERPYRLELPDGSQRWVCDFGLRGPAAALRDSDLAADLIRPASEVPERSLRHRFPDAFAAMWFGRTEIDGLNELVLRAGLGWRQITVLRAYAAYLRQAGFSYTAAAITRVLLADPDMACSLVGLFEAYFDPERSDAADDIALRVRAAIDEVVGLDADRILRAMFGLIAATLRTNYFRRDPDGNPPEYLSFKFDPRAVAELPRPRPRFEIFVYSPRVEGVHLRFGAVARGGLRWSDRLEDFRTEVLGLVKAQAVKNAVIVPVGAKGGFVVKRPPAGTGDPEVDRQALQVEGIACYRTFISGLLDVTDNIDHLSGAVLPPPRVVRRDGDDTYLVVAADKGTATFSDIANDVARSYGFWLGDAFASGGSAGYDHKGMGITARGAWESVKRHFAEMDIDTQTQDFTVVGVGDMSGDVFGNGMLLSQHIRLVAAFDHRHIFVDPAPDARSSFAERERLFGLTRSSWADYDRSLISEGGGVYDRSAKAIVVTPQVRTALGLDPGVRTLSPPEMIKAILLAPVDLLWNGGIGTYVKASTESHADVGDKAGDAVRVNADQLRVTVIGEGGNLGVTALGRVEFCASGGRMNTDAVDNSAGVDCSDHEVNIKVLLDTLVSTGELPRAERNPLLASMTDEIAELVLRDNISQNHGLGIARAHAAAMCAVHRRLIADLEARRGLDRELEALPSDAQLLRRAENCGGLTSPELANLMAHVKLSLKEDLLSGDLLDSPAMAPVLLSYFPAPLRERFGSALRRHPLRRQIIATTLVNEMVDGAGITYAFRLAEETSATTEDAVRAYITVIEIFDLRDLWRRIRTAPMPTSVRDELELESPSHPRSCVALAADQPSAADRDGGRHRPLPRGMRPLAAQVPAWRPRRAGRRSARTVPRADRARRTRRPGRGGVPADPTLSVAGRGGRRRYRPARAERGCGPVFRAGRAFRHSAADRGRRRHRTPPPTGGRPWRVWRSGTTCIPHCVRWPSTR